MVSVLLNLVIAPAARMFACRPMAKRRAEAAPHPNPLPVRAGRGNTASGFVICGRKTVWPSRHFADRRFVSWHGPAERRSHLPLPVFHGERVGVRGRRENEPQASFISLRRQREHVASIRICSSDPLGRHCTAHKNRTGFPVFRPHPPEAPWITAR